MEIVISNQYGGFGVSRVAMERMAELGSQEALIEIAQNEEWKADASGNWHEYDSYMREVARNDPYLLTAVKELGKAASGCHANLVIMEVDSRAPWYLHEYDGNESIQQFNPADRGCRLL
jgi:hypothetical protein